MPMKLIILDRDGVINVDSDQFIKSPDEWRPIPGSLEAIARLNQWGWRVVVASNQSGVGRGLFGMDTLNAINDKMVKSLAQVGGRLDAIFFCPHSADSTCDCRKPKPGMLLQIAERFNVELTDVPVVGDSLRDLQAAVAAGAKPYLVLTGKGEGTRASPELPAGTLIYPDLDAVAANLTA
jgi:D-glycero-D-manno-heptose 1,7-bisphosphate phosphatase